MNKPAPPKPIILYDHLPGILAIYPAILFALLAVLSLFRKKVQWFTEDQLGKIQTTMDGISSELSPAAQDAVHQLLHPREPFFNSHMLFWIGLTAMILWYIAYRFNLPKSKFLLVFGLAGTFVGIPVCLEIANIIHPFRWISNQLSGLEPTVNTGAWITLSLVFWGMFIINYIYSITHMKVRIDESGLTLYRLGGKGERFELIGLKTENEPLDYLELFLGGIGSLTLKTRMDKTIFTMKRVVWLYRIPWFPFVKGKLARIEEILNYTEGGSYNRSNAMAQREIQDFAGQDDNIHDEDDFVGDHEDSPERS